MKYMLLRYLDENAWLALDPSGQAQDIARYEVHARALVEKGKFVAGAPLHPTRTATTVRVKRGKRIITDGPFAETHEQLGGFTIIEADDLDEAIEIAAGFLGEGSDTASIEVPPVAERPSPAARQNAPG